jgi:predicted alpha/beta hydrolase
LAYRFLPWLADRSGVLPGRRIGFGGNEARGVIHDWARTAISGRYAATGFDVDLEAALARIESPVHATALARDWLGPPSSLRFLLSKMPRADINAEVLDADALGTNADHYAWMKAPDAIVARFTSRT